MHFLDLKTRVKKALYSLDEQEYVIDHVKEKLLEALGPEGFFIK